MAGSTAGRPSRPTRGAEGSRAIGGGGRKKRGGPLWLLLALLAVLLIALIIGLVSCGGDDDKTAPATATTATSAAAPPAASPTPAPATSAATLTADGTSLIAGQDFSSKVDSQATGTGLEVLSTTTGGFVVGKTGTDPTSSEAVFVEYGSKVGGDEDGSTYQAKVGDTVDLTGPVKKAPENPGHTLELDAAEATLVRDQGAYVNADTVTKAAG